MRKRNKLLALVTAAALLAAALPGALAAPAAEPTVHYKWKTVTNTAKDNLPALPTNVFYEDESVRTKALTLNKGTYYEADGPHAITSFGLYNGLGSQTDAETGKVSRYGVPYCVIKGLNGNDFIGQAENLWFDIAQMPELRVTGSGAVNLSMDYMYYTSTVSNNNVAFSRAMQVYVSLDGETFLPGYVGIRSATLMGGGKISASKTSGLLFQIETENLLDIPGVERGSVIRKIRVMPYGDHCRTYGNYYTSNLSVNVWATREDFEAACPSDRPELIELGEETMRAIPLAEAARIASIAWTSPQAVVTEYPKGTGDRNTGNAQKAYDAGVQFRGPVYERNLYCTRELFESSIVDGVYGYNGAGFAPTESGQNTAYGMSCAIFAYNCLSRVSRCGIWGVIWALSEPYTRLLGDLKTAERVNYTDVDATEMNTPQQVFESYALAKAGDVVVHYQTSANTIHIRLVKSVDVVRSADGTIDGEASVMTCMEQTTPINGFDDDSYFSSSRVNTKYTFAKLLKDAYLAYTMTDYAEGKVEREALQAVCGPLVKDGKYTDGVHLSFSSNYPIIKYTVTLHDMTRGEDLFSETKWLKRNQAMGENYESEQLNTMLAALPDGRYSIRLAVHSGPLLNTEQVDVPVTERAFPFTVGSVRRTPGDLNGDRKIDAQDAVLQKLVVGGYDVTANEDSADLNGDGKVNARDQVLLQRYLAGGYGLSF